MGVLLYCLIAGRKPFQGDVAAMLEGVLFGEPPSLASIVPSPPPALASIVERAMQKEPAHRWASAAEMSDALASLSMGRVSMLPALPLLAGGRVSMSSGRASTPIARTLLLPVMEVPPPTSTHLSAPSVVLLPAPPPSTPPLSPSAMPPPSAREVEPASRLRDTIANHRKGIRTVAIGLTAISAIASAGLALLVVAGLGGWWWWSSRAPVAPPPGVSAPASVASSPPGGMPATNTGMPLGGAWAGGGAASDDEAICAQATRCCLAFAETGLMEASTCSVFTLPRYPVSACHEVFGPYATVLRSRGRDASACIDPEAP
jgi:serine/threonine-protein kinase